MAYPTLRDLFLFLIHSPIKISVVEGSRSQVQLNRVFLDLQSLSSHAAKLRNNLGRPLDASSIYGLCLYRNLTQLDGCMSRNAAYCLYILTPHMSRNNATFNHQLCALSHSCLPYSRGMPCRRLRREMRNGMHKLVSCNRALPMGVFKSM